MKKWIMILALSALAVPAMAQETNTYRRKPGESRPEWNKGDRQHQERRFEMSPEEEAKMKERKLQLMEQSLKEIGVTPQQRVQILALQNKHREKIKANMQRMQQARKKLSELQESGAPSEARHAAIREIADAQSEQLIIFDDNRMLMEQILGREKFDEFMEKARSQYRSHGRRGGSGLPPRPDMPPIPQNGSGDRSPPMPNTGAKANLPPLP